MEDGDLFKNGSGKSLCQLGMKPLCQLGMKSLCQLGMRVADRVSACTTSTQRGEGQLSYSFIAQCIRISLALFAY